MPWLTCARAPAGGSAAARDRAAGAARGKAVRHARGRIRWLRARRRVSESAVSRALQRLSQSAQAPAGIGRPGARRDAGGVPQSQRAAAGHAGAAAGGLSVPDGAERRRGSQASGFTAADGRGDRRTDQCGGRSLGPARIAQGRSEIEVFRRALRGLPERTQQMLLAARVHELPHAEIARRYGVSERIVSKEIKRALDHCGRAR